MPEHSQIVRCPHCSNTTPHRLLFAHKAPEYFYATNGDGVDALCDELYELVECLTCKCISLYCESGMDGERNLTWPKSDVLDKSVPAAVADHYYEAKKIQNLSPSAFVVMIRRALEALCADRGVAVGPLHKSLKKLAESGEIPERLADVTSVLRQIGNEGAHHTGTKVNIPMTWTIDEFFRVLIEYVYVAPKKLEGFQSRLNKDTDAKTKA